MCQARIEKLNLSTGPVRTRQEEQASAQDSRASFVVERIPPPSSALHSRRMPRSLPPLVTKERSTSLLSPIHLHWQVSKLAIRPHPHLSVLAGRESWAGCSAVPSLRPRQSSQSDPAICIPSVSQVGMEQRPVPHTLKSFGASSRHYTPPSTAEDGGIYGTGASSTAPIGTEKSTEGAWAQMRSRISDIRKGEASVDESIFLCWIAEGRTSPTQIRLPRATRVRAPPRIACAKARHAAVPQLSDQVKHRTSLSLSTRLRFLII